MEFVSVVFSYLQHTELFEEEENVRDCNLC